MIGLEIMYCDLSINEKINWKVDSIKRHGDDIVVRLYRELIRYHKLIGMSLDEIL